MRGAVKALLAGLVSFLIVAAPWVAAAEVETVDMGSAEPFALLAGAGITNTGSTTITGDVGSYPTTSQTGFETVIVVGTNHGGNNVTQEAKADLLIAYDDARLRTGATPIEDGELGGLTLVPGVYEDDNSPDSLANNGILTLDGEGDPNATFIFQSDSTLITGSNSSMILTNGTQACNVFWQVGSSATLGSGSHLEGTLLVLTDISMNAGATIDGRALAYNGAVTMINNTITNTPCADLDGGGDDGDGGAGDDGGTGDDGGDGGTGDGGDGGTGDGGDDGGAGDGGDDVEVPFFPSLMVAALASLGAVGIFMALRKRA